MEYTEGNLNSLFFSFNALLQKSLAQAWTDYVKFATVINSSTGIEKYPMTIIGGAMREWVGERVINSVSGKVLEVANKNYEQQFLGRYLVLHRCRNTRRKSTWG